MNRWLAGLAGAVIAAVIGFLLVGEGGLLNPKPEPKGAEVRITAFNGPDYSSVGEVPVRAFSVYNAGDAAAEQCNIFWNPWGPDTSSADSVLSEEFGLPPGETTDITITADAAYGTQALWDESASVFCSANDYHSPILTRPVNTYAQGG